MKHWYTHTPPSWLTPPTHPYNPPYHPQPMNQPFQRYVPKQSHWNNPSQGWRPQQNQLPTLMPPPQPQRHLTHVAPPRLPIPIHPNLNPNNR